jgi:hypothetical protein
MSNIQLNLAFKTACGSGIRKVVLVALADAASDDGICWPSTFTLARRCDISRQSVMNGLAALQSMGLLSVTRFSGSSNEYRLTLGVNRVDTSTSLTCQRRGHPGVNRVDTHLSTTLTPPVNGVDTNHKEPSGEPKVETKETPKSQIAKAEKKRTKTSVSAASAKRTGNCKTAKAEDSPAKRPGNSKTPKADDHPVPRCLSEEDGFAEALEGWIENRKEMKKPATARAIRGLIEKLAERPGMAVEALREAVMQPWQGFEWEWLEKRSERFREAKVYRDPRFRMKEGEKLVVVKTDYAAALRKLREQKEVAEAEECWV